MRTILYPIGALILIGAITLASAQDVSIPDSGLNAAIRDALQKPRGSLTAQDLLSLTNLNACCRNISSAQGLEGARNLISLDLQKNRLTNFFLPSELTNLAVLDLSNNSLTQCSFPNHLADLRLAKNNLTSLTLPVGMTNLVELDLTANLLTNIVLSPDLTHLQSLNLIGNQLTSLTLPPDLTTLTSLFLDGNLLAALVLSEPLAATNLAETVASLRDQNISVFTYPLAIQLTFPRRTQDGAFTFAVIGPPGVYTVFGTVDFSAWSELGVLTNDLGFARFSDAAFSLSPQKFYSARP